MIYADNPCLPVGGYGNEQIPGRFREATDLAGFWSHWKYSREDRGFRMLLARTPYVAVWDDHEVANDFGPLRDTRDQPPYTPGVHLLPLGLEAFLDYNPIDESARTPKRLYRSLRWGRHLELFVLDTRQYRDAATQEDLPERPKTMLGREQLTWLEERLAASDATWKVIVSSVPMSVPTGYPPEFGRDGWANHDRTTGYENELRSILRFAQRRGIRNQLWIVTDVHFGAVFSYEPFEDAPDFRVHEILAGPLHAALFPNRAFDASLGAERLFLFGPESMHAVKTYEEARRWFNFAGLEIDEAGALGAQLIDISGRVLFGIVLRPR
jgi:alkaline phosphatase D